MKSTIVAAMLVLLALSLSSAQVLENTVFITDPTFSPTADPKFGCDFTTDQFNIFQSGTFQGYYSARGDKDSFHGCGVDLTGEKSAMKAIYAFMAQNGDGVASKFVVFFGQVEDLQVSGASWQPHRAGIFEQGYRFWFQEDGDNWKVQLESNKAGQTSVHASGSIPGSTNPQELHFTVDSNTPHMELQTSSGAVLMEADLPSDRTGAFWSQAFYGYSNSGIDATTYIMSPNLNPESTKVIDLDASPPEISAFSWSPTELAKDEPLFVTVEATDDWTENLDARVHWSLNGSASQSAAMSKNGDQYTGSVPGQPGSSTLSFWVTVRDQSSMEARTDTIQFQIPRDGRSGASNQGGGSDTGGSASNLDEGGRDMTVIWAILGGVVALGLGMVLRSSLGYPKLGLWVAGAGIVVGGIVALGAGLGFSFSQISTTGWVFIGVLASIVIAAIYGERIKGVFQG